MARMNSMLIAKDDDHALRHGYRTHEGADMGDQTSKGTYAFGQQCPMFFNREGASVPIEGMYRGRSCFLIGGGPSLNTYDISLLKSPGVLTLGMNNSVKVVRPNLWTCVDDPSRFLYSIWMDPQIMKFVPQAAFEKELWISTHVAGASLWHKAGHRVGDCPNIFGYRRNEKFAAHRFLTENTINWGCHKDHGGCRSVMLAALRMLYLLGIRTVYLVGVDLEMEAGKGYAFAEGRTAGAIKNNKNTYNRMLTEYFPQLKPYFDAAGYKVLNCNPNRKFNTFPYVPFEEAIKESIGLIGDPSLETTEGMYLKLSEKERLKTQEAAFKATQGKIAAKDD
jgi:hypothetical protein